MQEFKGLKLVERKPFACFGLIFWSGDELSQSLEFNNEEECDKILEQVINGNGVEVKYDFSKEETIVYPLRVIKVKFTNEYSLTEDGLKKINTFTDDIKFPNKLGKNEYQPVLSISERITKLTNQ